MSANPTRRPALRLVPKPAAKIDADLVAFTVMEYIDANFAGMWGAAPVGARSSIRNAVVKAVIAEAARTGVAA